MWTKQPPWLPLPACGERSDREAVRVRGTLRTESRKNCLKHAAGVSQHVVVPESQHGIAVISQPSIPNSISRAVCMLAAIDFYYDAAFTADEVNDVWAKRCLAYEFESAERAAAKSIPKFQFGIG